ncbi:hypothetical protein MOMA_01535 [Moraxella macacae 0408225]|uniref:DUF4062 domain-containing protein n=1 Tax=Moraxella macacae 0408225 TaxID=1230338 RepID=L2F843_9GAMM|nr:DUF4062 domain-containing protein [Moraxella macacae]ELA09050.1 hypothetical protein MOMA_01535 [Moraxella macacae 0408225]
MPIKQRYHVHVCLVRNEHPEFENALQLALSEHYFLTWDLIAHPIQFMDYSKQQIDRCDYLIFALGNGYGHLSPSGVSNLHLSYIYARTKNKPMLALIKAQTPAFEYSRQRLDLAALIEKELGSHAIYFQRSQEAMSACKQLLQTLSDQYPTAGWVRTKSMNSPIRQATLLRPKTLTNSAVSAKQSQDKIVIKRDDVVLVNYSAHAYQGGNLQDLVAAHTFTWGEVLDLLTVLPQPFSNDMMLKQLNDSLRGLALTEATKTLPNVHAVSRCQINAVDFQWLKKQLVASGWLILAKEEHSIRELWRVKPH